MSRYMLGSELSPTLQQEALAVFGRDRFTGEYRPKWIDEARTPSHRRNGPPDFTDDAQWLAQTEFPVSGQGDKLHLARNGQRCRTHYLRDPLLGTTGADGVTGKEAEGYAVILAKQSHRAVWVMVEGQRVGDMTFSRPDRGLPHSWRVATPSGDLY